MGLRRLLPCGGVIGERDKEVAMIGLDLVDNWTFRTLGQIL
jgi:hypothetical protein